jgi:hypothetical protein
VRSITAQSLTFGADAQHTSRFPQSAQNLNGLKWSTDIDLNNAGALTHYGSPLVTANNTVLVPVKTATNGFRIDAFNGANAAAKYSLSSDYILPAHNWIPAYNICIATGSFGTRLYYAGAGGTVWHVDNVDSNTPGTPVREVFYTSLVNYNGNTAAYNNSIFVNTPITADSAGNIYFGFRVQGTAPAPLNTTRSGFARIDSNGNGSLVLVDAATGDALIDRDSHNLAPALSNDESTLYVGAKASSINNYAYLLALDPATLATKRSVFLRDPRNGSGARIPDDGTSSPMVGPDGDVYFGVLANSAINNGSRGFLLHFNSDLSVQKTPGGFGWDYTPGVVPANMVPSYTGPSTYLLFCKYNDYAFGDGSGVNRVAILDPNDTQLDPHTGSAGLVEMREVLTVIGATPDDAGPSFPLAVQEFCINAPAINPATNSVFFDSEDGHIYRWNLATNSLDQAVALSAGIGQPYVPSVIGPDGTVYTLNGGNFFAVGSRPGVDIVITSSSPDLRNTVFGEQVTFTATVSGAAPAPTGTVTFTDVTYNGLSSVTTTLAANVPLNAGGQASVTTSALAAGGSNLGNHFVTATYSGDAGHTTSSVTMMQKIHANASTTLLTSSSPNSNAGSPVTFTATVSANPTGAGTPTGMVTFQDGTTVIGQVPLGGGVASITRSNLSTGSHTIRAIYASDTRFAASSGLTTQIVGPSVQFTVATTNTQENIGSVNLSVSRSGDSSGAVTVNFATSDAAGANNCTVTNGAASGRCDYGITLGSLTFAAGETARTISIPIVDDAYAEGTETFTVTLTSVAGGNLGSPASTTVNINDNESVNGANPLPDAGFFVRQHYLDFLNREPDTDGFNFWINQITACGADAQCLEVKRINVSASFFLSIEFQETGYLVERIYKTSYGDATGTSTNGGSHQLPVPIVRLNEFLTDTGKLAKGVIVIQPGWEQVLENNKQTFIAEFVLRTRFTTAFPLSMTPAQFVDALNTNAGNPLSLAERNQLVSDLASNTKNRAQVLRAVAEDPDLVSSEKNRAFVLMQFFGYLRRNPDDLQDIDHTGYDFWLEKLNSFGGNFITAEMVKAFIQSPEYVRRFGP